MSTIHHIYGASSPTPCEEFNSLPFRTLHQNRTLDGQRELSGQIFDWEHRFAPRKYPRSAVIALRFCRTRDLESGDVYSYSVTSRLRQGNIDSAAVVPRQVHAFAAAFSLHKHRSFEPAAMQPQALQRIKTPTKSQIGNMPLHSALPQPRNWTFRSSRKPGPILQHTTWLVSLLLG